MTDFPSATCYRRFSKKHKRNIIIDFNAMIIEMIHLNLMFESFCSIADDAFSDAAAYQPTRRHRRYFAHRNISPTIHTAYLQTHAHIHNEDVKVIKSDELAGSAGGKLPSVRRKLEYVSVFENRC